MCVVSPEAIEIRWKSGESHDIYQFSFAIGHITKLFGSNVKPPA